MGQSILILEDHDEIQNNLKNLILSIDASNKVLATGQAEIAEEWLKAYNIDILYVDIQLAGKKTGWDFIKEAQAIHPKIPVIVVSSTAEQVEIINAFNGNLILFYIDKPYTAETVLESYEQAVSMLKYLTEDAISLTIDDIERQVKAKDIYVIKRHPKKQKKALVLHYDIITGGMVETECSIRGAITEMSGLFKQKKTLVRCHQSYLVNPRHILGYDHAAEELLLADGSRVSVGSKYFY